MAAKISELRFLRQEDAEDFGSKAANLGELTTLGVKVPHGYALDKVPSKGEGMAREARDITDILRYEHPLRKIYYAVRSSAIGEDSEERSYAGQFESKLNVPFDEVYKTMRHMAAHIPDRVYAYDPEFKPKNLRFIVQEMVPAVRAGVIFTRDPMDYNSMVMETVDGLGDKLVSGEVTPITETRLRDSCKQPRTIWETAWRIEQHFGRAQDIEFAIDKGGTVWFLQARPITS